MSLATVFGNAQLGAWAEEFMGFLTERECKNSTMACAICDHRTPEVAPFSAHHTSPLTGITFLVSFRRMRS